MEGFILALQGGKNDNHGCQKEVHLSTLNGLHVIPAEERDFGNVFQATICGWWESPGVFRCITGEWLFVEADCRARWDLSGLPPLKPYRW
jgi:hypothetical protein